MLPSYSVGEGILVFTIVGIVLLCIPVVISWAVRPMQKREETTYECGMIAKGEARSIGFNFIGYAALFLIFDLAALYLFLYAVAPDLPIITSLSFFVGIATLCLIIIYGTQRRKYYVA